MASESDFLGQKPNGESIWKWAVREMKGVGIAAIILAFGMYEWHTLVKSLQETMVRVAVTLERVERKLGDK